jgi:hypothetical protein
MHCNSYTVATIEILEPQLATAEALTLVLLLGYVEVIGL